MAILVGVFGATDAFAQARIVHRVVVSPQSVSLTVGQTITLAASVEADAGVTDRTVTWSSSDATVASVGADGKVTAVKAVKVSITAVAKANPGVKGAAVVSVTGTDNPAVPTVIVSAINQNPTGIPANVQGAAGQLDVVLNVDANGGKLSSISATIKCGNDSLVQTRTIADTALPRGKAPVTFSFNTAQFNTTTGVPSLHNGTCRVIASATAGTGSTARTATNAQAVQFTLANAGRGVGSPNVIRTSVVHSVVVSPQSVSLKVGQTITLAASVDADAGVTDRTVTWSSSDATIASVGADGKVTAVKAGKVSITAAAKANRDVKGAAIVSVTGADNPAEFRR